MDEGWLVDAAVWAAVGPYRDAPGAVVADTGAVRWYTTPIDYEGLNGVLWARLPEHGLDDAIDRALEPFRETGLPMLWHVGPSSSPATLPEALKAAGLSHYEDEPGMVADLGTLGRRRPLRPGSRSARPTTRTTCRSGPRSGPGSRRVRTWTPWSSCGPAAALAATRPPRT
jgi:hypothetical protein